MRIFENTEEAYPEILRDIVKFGRLVKSNTVQNWKEVGDEYLMSEVQLYSFCVVDDSDMFDTCKDSEWVKEEFRERLVNVNPGIAWELRKNYWETVMTDGKFCYTYGERMYEIIPKVIELLKSNEGTRQAVITLWQYGDHFLTNGEKRVPCSMYYNFHYREQALDLIYHMRSSDYYEHFRNDFTLASMLKQYVAKELGVKPGKTFMSVDSLHAYKKDWASLNIIY